MSLTGSVPRHKTVPGTRFVIDGFKHSDCGASAYFLTHAHSDHYGGLSEKWTAGTVVCSEVTARLVRYKLSVPEHVLRPIPLDTPVDVHGVTVTAIDANHCPGAVQFLFQLPDGSRYVHTGDMRFSDAMLRNPHLCAFRDAGVDGFYLDTTYCLPKHTFPAQEVSIEYVARVIRELVHAPADAPSVLCLISTYGIGKERILSAVAAAAGCSIGVTPSKRGALACLSLPDLDIYTTDERASPVRVVQWGVLGETWPYFRPNFVGMEKARVDAGVDRVVGFVPTGWMYDTKKGSAGGEAAFPIHRKGACEVHLVPYSEHSSFDELQTYVRWMRPREVIPTVGVDKADTAEGERVRASMLKHFALLIDQTRAKAALLQTLFGTKTGALAEPVKQQAADVPDERLPGCDNAIVIDDDIGGEGPSSDAAVSPEATLRAIVGEASMNDEQARRLLQSCGGDINAAMNKFLDGSGGAAKTPLAASAGQKRPRAPASGAKQGVQTAQPSIASFFKKPRGADGPERAGAAAPVPQQQEHAVIPASTPPSPLSQPQRSPVALQSSQPAADAQSVRVMLPVAEYDPVKHACWSSGQAVPYMHIAATCEYIVSTRSRLSIAATLTNCFRSLMALSPDDVLPALYLIVGRLAPEYESGAELKVGGSSVSAALIEATGASRGRIHELYRQTGDLGDAATLLKSQQRLLTQPQPLTVPGVFAALRRISAEQGAGGVARRKAHCLALLRAARGPEIRFLVRLLVGAMRIGASRVSVLSALAAAAVHHHSNSAAVTKDALDAASAAIARAYSLCPSFDALVPLLIEQGPERLGEVVRLVPGTPCPPMLAQPTTGPHDALTRLGPCVQFLAEWKYDGQRCQMHILPAAGGEQPTVRLFTRNSADCTASYPDVCATLLAAAAGGPAMSSGGVVLDGEMVAVTAQGTIRPFQELATRKKGAITVDEVTVNVCVFMFDCMVLDGRSLVDEPLEARRAAIAAALPSMASLPPHRLCMAASEAFVERAEGDEEALATVLEATLCRSVSESCEGLMVKALSSPYEADKRSTQWLKLKKDYMEGHAELDLVPIGAWYGQGRKSKWFSPILMAVYDPETETYASVCRVLSGFSDAFYKEMYAFYTGAGYTSESENGGDVENHILEGKPPYYETGDTPDVWFAPCHVWEIRGADFSLSARHAAARGRVPQDRGVSLRFPRFMRTRPDLRPEQATGPEQLAALYHGQRNKTEGNGIEDDVDE